LNRRTGFVAVSTAGAVVALVVSAFNALHSAWALATATTSVINPAATVPVGTAVTDTGRVTGGTPAGTGTFRVA
jgi:hypothetical protein